MTEWDATSIVVLRRFSNDDQGPLAAVLALLGREVAGHLRGTRGKPDGEGGPRLMTDPRLICHEVLAWLCRGISA